MIKHFLRNIAVAVLLVASLVVAGADPMVPSGGSPIFNIPPPAPPAVDWFARTVSGLAFLVALAAFVWGRVDKYRERKAAKAAKDPSLDIDVAGPRDGPFAYELKIVNRDDVSLSLLSLSCDPGFKLETHGATVLRDGTFLDYNGFRIDRGNEETFRGMIKSSSGRREANFVVKVRINLPKPRIHEVRIKRALG